MTDSTQPDTESAAAASDNAARLTRLGHYSLLRIIAEGGMGTVYEAIQDKPRRVVAVKRMHHGLTSRAALRRFDTESQLLARLRHPAIAQVFEAGTDRQGHVDVPYFAMEYIPGAMPITDYAREKKLSVRERLELFVQVCDAVQHAHEKGILHRDLKPQNILVDLNGKPKVIDFGIARAVDADQVPASLQTNPDQLLGTLQYMSPEQLDGDPRELDARADIYALGVVLYELLCGQLPYDLTRSRLTEASRMLREQPPPRPSAINSELKGDLETVVLMAFHKDRSRRYQSARDLAGDLRRVLGDETISARLDSPIYTLRVRLRAGIRRHPVGSLIVAAILFLIAEMGGARLDDELNITPRLETFAVRHLTVFPHHELPSVAMIVVRNVIGAAKLGGVETSKPDDFTKLRPINGKVLSRLAATRARAVMLDYFIVDPTTPQNDQALLQGIDDLKQRGIGVVAAVSTSQLQEGKPHMLPALLERVTWGVARNVPWLDRPSSAYLAVRVAISKNGLPGFALAGFAAARAPGVQPTVDIDTASEQLRIGYYLGDRRVHPTDMVAPTHILETRDPSNVDLEEFDQFALCYVAMPSDSVLQKSTFDVEEVVAASKEDLQRWFDGKVVMLAAQVPGHDELKYFDKRRLFRSQLQAVTTDALINDRGIQRQWIRVFGRRLNKRIVEATIILAAIVAGAFIAKARNRKLAWGWRLLIVVVVVGASILLYRSQQLLYSPWLPLVGAITSFELAHAYRRAASRRLN